MGGGQVSFSKKGELGKNLPGRVTAFQSRLSADEENRVRDVVRALAKQNIELTGVSKHVANPTDIDFPAFAVIKPLGQSPLVADEVLYAQRPERAGLARVLFTRAPIPAGTSGTAYEGGVQVARCKDAVIGGYAVTKQNDFVLQSCTVGPFRILARLAGIAWLSANTDYVLVDVLGEMDTGIVVTQASANPVPYRVLDFIGFSVVNNGDGTITIG